MINWKVRVRQKWFWITLIPAVLLLLDQLWGLWAVLGSIQAGHLYDGPVMEALLSLAGTAFAVMVILGIPVDTTTQGYGDSPRALMYEAPAPNASAYGLREYEEQSEAADAKMVDWAAAEEAAGECTPSADGPTGEDGAEDADR